MSLSEKKLLGSWRIKLKFFKPDHLWVDTNYIQAPDAKEDVFCSHHYKLDFIHDKVAFLIRLSHFLGYLGRYNTVCLC